MALDDVSEKNGCLFFMPGSHRDAELGRVAGGFGNINKIFQDCASAPLRAISMSVSRRALRLIAQYVCVRARARIGGSLTAFRP